MQLLPTDSVEKKEWSIIVNWITLNYEREIE
jgi:hypothetical protein